MIRMFKQAALVAAAWMVVAAPAHATNFGYGEWADELGIDPDVSYSAVRVMRTDRGDIELKEYRAPGRTYTEFDQQGVKGGMLMFEEQGKAYVLMPQMGMYREVSIDQAMEQGGGNAQVVEVSRVGDETINGMDTTKYASKFQDKNGTADGFIWVSEDGIPIRWHMTYTSGRQSDTFVMDLKNLQIGPQDPALFEVPANLQPMPSFGNLFGGRQQQNAQPNSEQAPAQAQDAPTDEEVEEGMKGLRKGLNALRRSLGQ